MLRCLIRLRPYAFHCCSALNFESIQRSRTLQSTARLLHGTTSEYWARKRRPTSFIVERSDCRIEIRDNKPLRPGSVALEAGSTMDDFLADLNSRVFLWPGDERGPIKPGRLHFEHYRGEGPVHLIRVPLASLAAENAGRVIAVSYCNSGSARHHQGRPVVRGPSTFTSIETATRPASKVKEITLKDVAALPDETEWSVSIGGPWGML